MKGLRISEALGVDIDDVDIDRGHRTLRIVRTGGQQVTVRGEHRRVGSPDGVPRPGPASSGRLAPWLDTS
jgi:hypothetical protein